MQLVIFEDKKFENLYPLVLLRPTFELKCGCTTLLEKILRKFKNSQPAFFMRDCLVPVFKNKFPDYPANDIKALQGKDLLLINGRLLISEKDDDFWGRGGKEEIGTAGGDIVYARVKKETISSLGVKDFPSFLEGIKKKIKTKEVSASFITYPWHLIEHNPEAIREDFAFFKKSGMEGKVSPLATVYGKEDKVYVAKGAEVQPFVVIDTTRGPVIIERGAVISPYSRIEGPSFIGEDTYIFGANIREGCSIGPVSRIGGEVEETIIHGYTNKAHDGFLGHSYVGEWVNLGALTTNSDLKNDYSNVVVQVNGEMQDTGQTKIGSFIGDHTKTSLGTFLNTGTVVGIMSNLVGDGGVLPKFIPSFCWYLNGKFSKGYGFKMMIETGRKVMARRKLTLSEEEAALLKEAYEITRSERDILIKKSRR